MKRGGKWSGQKPAGERAPDLDTPPHSVEAEQGVLGSILVSAGDALPECIAKIRSEFFYVPAHRTIYIALCDVWDSGKKIDLIDFTQRLRDKKILEAIGGAAFVTHLFTFVPTAANVAYYLDIMRDKYMLREIIAASAEAARQASEPGAENDGEPIKLLDALESRTASLRSLHGGNGAEISFRSPSHILAMPRNPHANFLGDRLLGIAQSLVLAGIGGIGKSRLLLQLLVALIIGRDWCGIQTHHTKGKRWMLIQTQNGNQRLQDDLEPLKKYAGGDWPLVEKNLLIHTLETDRDLMLHLSEPENVRLLEKEIRAFNPIGVAFDPLNDVGIGDLNKDVDMMATCSAIGRVSRAGNPERAIIVAAHAITGVAGMKKAFGFEAAGFGRNSKVLQTWARAFINIIPATEDFSILALTCGKCNDGRMFSPFAVRLGDSMIYEQEPDFDIAGFREQLERPKKGHRKIQPEIVAEINWPKSELDKKQLAAAVMEQADCQKTRAYELIDEAVMYHLIRYSKQTEIYRKK